MIIDSPLLTTLCVGTDRIIPTDGDSQVIVPPIIQPVVVPTLPLQLGGVGSAPQQNSILVSLQATRTNQAAAISTIASLLEGLYEFYFQLAMRSSYLGTGSAPAVQISLLVGSTENPLCGLYSFIGAEQTYYHGRILLNTPMTLRLTTEAVAAAQTLDVVASCNIQRII